MATEIDIMNFGGLARILISICNTASMGKKILEFKKYIYK